MNNKAKGIFSILIGIIVLSIYILHVYGLADYNQWFTMSSVLITNLYEQARSFIIYLYIAIAIVVITKMMFICYNMGKTKITFPSNSPNQPLLTAPVISNPCSSVQLQVAEVPDKTVAPNDRHHAIRQRHEQEKTRQKQAVLDCVIEYVEHTMAPYMKSEDLDTLCENIRNWELSKEVSLSPTITNGQLTTLDLRHLAWNIGERFKWNGEQRATFAKQSFPYEFRDLEIKSIRQNLRQQGTCRIPIDIPAKSGFEFNNHAKYDA